MLILLEWAVVAQCPCDPAAALLLESRRGARRKKSRRGHLCSTLLYAGLLAQLGGLFMFNLISCLISE